MTDILCPLHSAARRSPAAVAVMGDDIKLTYRELDQRVAATATRLQSASVTPADRIAILSNCTVETIILIWSVMRIQAVVCLIDHRLPLPLIRAALKKSNSRLLIDRADKSDYSVSDCILGISFDELFDRSNEQVSSQPSIDPKKPATILFTSGSSRKPKAVVHTLANHLASARGVNERLSFQKGDRWLLSLPLHHAGGIAPLFRAVLIEGTVVIPCADQSLAHAVRQFRVTHLSIVPIQLFRLLRDHQTDQSALHGVKEHAKAILLGGAPIPDSIVHEAYDAGLPIVCSYGLTEMASTVCTTQLHDPVDNLLTCGEPLDGREVTISSDGEILVRGETLFAGYAEGSKVLGSTNSDGWFATGDIGRTDSAGALVITGRRDAMFISAGENIHPEMIERELLGLSKESNVIDAVVVPVSDEEFGQRPVAFVRSAAGGTLNEGSLRQHLKTRLPRHLLPIRFFSLPDNDRNTIKQSRHELTVLAEQLCNK